jgi:ApbE superfamily uncharacterized protein (UPF0280 family)
MIGAGPQAALLPDGERLHLQHGPIDLIIGVSGTAREVCYTRAIERFQTVLTGLVAELEPLRQPLTSNNAFKDPVARRMAKAIGDYTGVFVTPMVAVAGAVADEILAAMISVHSPKKAYVNNGGDIAFYLPKGQTLTLRSPAGNMRITAQDKSRGVATSGWQGRSHSLGIADAVTVAAQSAAAADVAATLIANAVDLPGHPAIQRSPANLLSPDSDLRSRAVTTHVGHLTNAEVVTALAQGASYAQSLCDKGHIQQAALALRGQYQLISATMQPAPIGDLAHV